MKKIRDNKDWREVEGGFVREVVIKIKKTGWDKESFKDIPVSIPITNVGVNGDIYPDDNTPKITFDAIESVLKRKIKR